MEKYIKVVAQLSKVVIRNKKNQLMEPMYTAREKGKNIMSYVNFSEIQNIIKYFPELKQNIRK